MALAQVAYNLSTDAVFAAEWDKNPLVALANKGVELTKEEFDALVAGLRVNQEVKDLSLLAMLATGWR